MAAEHEISNKKSVLTFEIILSLSKIPQKCTLMHLDEMASIGFAVHGDRQRAMD